MSAPVRSKHYLLPDLADLLFVAVLYLALFLKPNMMFIDGSTGWHLVSGNYILQHHQVPRADIISYTFAGKPWIAYEWLSDLLMAALVRLGGLNLLAVIVAGAIALLFFLLYRRCRQSHCNFVIAATLTMFGAIVSAIHWLARPHLFTFFGVYIFYTLLDRYYNGMISSKKLAVSLCFCMLVWSNCHPGFVIGLGLIGIYLVCAIIAYITETVQAKRVADLIVILVLNLITTLCNPYGFGLYSYIGHYLFKTNHILEATDEFLSPVFHGGMQPALLEIMFALFIIGLVISKGRINLPDLLVYLVFAHLGLSAQRNMALYAIVAVPIIARLYSDTILNPAGGRLYQQLNDHWRALLTKLNTINAGFTENERLCSLHILPMSIFAALVCIALNGGQVLGFNILHSDFPEKNIPNKTLNIIKKLHLDPQEGMSFDNWGGVIKYKIDYPVFIDDRADFYGEQFYSQYAVLTQILPGWQKLLDQYKISWVLLPYNNRLTNELRADSHWQQIGEDQASVLMMRKK